MDCTRSFSLSNSCNFASSSSGFLGDRALMFIVTGVELSATTGTEVLTTGTEFSVATVGNVTAFAMLLLKSARGALVKSKVMGTLRDV